MAKKNFISESGFKFTANINCVSAVFGNTVGSLVGKIIYLSSDKEHGYKCSASQDTLGFYLGVSTKTIERSLKLLLDEGLIIDHTPNAINDSHKYTVNEKALIAMDNKFNTFTEALDKLGLLRQKVVVKANGTTYCRYRYVNLSYAKGSYYVKMSDNYNLTINILEEKIRLLSKSEAKENRSIQETTPKPSSTSATGSAKVNIRALKDYNNEQRPQGLVQ